MNGLSLIVCLKQVPDPEAPISGYRIDSEAKRVSPVGVPPVISPFDENALQAALRLKEMHGAKLTAISAGHNLSKSAIRKALSVGADELILVDDPAYAPDKLDGRGTALVLAKATKKIGKYDLILTGRQAADTNAGVVGLYLAEILGIVAVSLARKVVLEDRRLTVDRVMPDGYEVVEAEMPALITVSAEIGELRSPRLKDMREAKSKPLLMWTAKDIGLEQSPQRELILRELTAPRRERACLFIEGATPQETGANLALKLREDKII